MGRAVMRHGTSLSLDSSPEPVKSPLLVPGLAVEVKVPAEPLSVPMGKTAELTCSHSTSVGDNFALEWSCVQPGKPISASRPILYFTSGHLYPVGSMAEQASLLQSPPTGDVQPSDTGTYLCQVNNPPDFYTNGLGIIYCAGKDGQLILSNLSLISSCIYCCVATNHLDSASCELTVTDSSKVLVAESMTGVLLGVLFLSVVAFCLIRMQKERRKRPKEICRGSDFQEEDAIAHEISQQTSVQADSSSLLQRLPSASTVTITKFKLPIIF
ncbi:LOW QUALITY PROTEIN: V-set and immunoglobulin domain-containing protein 2 [Rhynchocyon petersi]